MRYFEFEDDKYIPGRWYLASPVDSHHQDVEPWEFTRGEPVEHMGPLVLPLREAGIPLEFTEADMGMPIANERVASILKDLAPKDLQLIPVSIVGRPEPYMIINATHAIACVDEARCEEVQFWKPEDGRPERVGDYSSIYGLRIDPSKVGDHKLFRIKGWLVSLVVSEDVKDALEREKVLGPKFFPV